ncbi:MAG TPA: choice-of-anchor tandem repeat GloVer-containing protein [Candidatus Baltobacteraceae bacterium]|nr:choice-of-anchor tandem repeat GloVer-containing protein [Candidatus Baltobacteraceae bacterium]
MKLFSLWVTACLGLALQSADAAPYRLVHAFRGGKSDGRTPTYEASLTPAGPYLYGMTQDGGQYNNGVLFQIKTDATPIKIVHAFNGWAVLNMTGSKEDGALPCGTPVLDGSTLYGMTQEGGSNGFEYGEGTVFSVNTNGGGFQVLHSFGALNDGYNPRGSLILSGSTLYGMTEAGGTNGISEGIIFSIGTDGSGYQILHSFISEGGAPQGSLTLWDGTLFGMTAGEIFLLNTNGSGYLPVHVFAGAPYDGANASGSLVREGAYLYGMTSGGGANSVGTVFQLYLIGSRFQILHSFALDEAYQPFGDLTLSGSTLYGMTYGGVTNFHGGFGGSGAVFQIDTNGSGYQVMHTFQFPSPASDGSLPYGTPIVLGSELYGMTSLGGSEGLPLGSTDGGCIFSLTITPGSSSGGGVAPTITTTSPLPNGKVGVAYHQQLAASGGTTPYTWAVSAGHLPPGVTLSAGGVLGGKPTAGKAAAFSIKVTGHDKLSSTQAFDLTIEVDPTLTVSAPKSGLRVTSPTLTVSGTASDAVGGVGAVYFQLNGGAWTKAQTANGFVNWNYPGLPLAADANVFSAYAVDTFGNYSKTNTVKFEYFVTGPLIVKTTGGGSFMPNDNGKNFQIGANFSITAKPARGFDFVDWTNGLGEVLTNKTALKFVMESNLTLVANFAAVPESALAHDPDRPVARPDKIATKPFLDGSGIYYGLFAQSEGARQNANSGAIRLALTESGSFTGKLLVGPDTLAFSGSFDPSGATRILLARKQNDWTVTLQLDPAGQALTGEVTDGAFVAQVKAYRNAFSSSNPAKNYQGTYRVTIPATNDAPLAALGFESVTVDSLGNVTFGGTLLDGTMVSQTSLVSRDGYWPLYLQLYGGNGSFWAWSQFTNGTVHSLPKSASWISRMNSTQASADPAAITDRAVQIIGSSRDAGNQ